MNEVRESKPKISIHVDEIGGNCRVYHGDGSMMQGVFAFAIGSEYCGITSVIIDRWSYDDDGNYLIHNNALCRETVKYDLKDVEFTGAIETAKFDPEQ